MSPLPAAAGRPAAVDWPGLIRRYQQHKLRSGEIKESTWERLYKPRMALLLKTAKGPPSPRDGKHLLEAQADLWRQRPGCRTRRLQIQYTAALLRWGVSEGLLPAQWAPRHLCQGRAAFSGDMAMAHRLLIEIAVSITDHKKNPMATVAAGDGMAVAVLNRNEPVRVSLDSL